ASDLPGDQTTHAFLWQNDTMTDLGTLPGDFSSGATGINENGLIVGNSCDVNGNCRAFVWEGGVMTDLNTLTTNGSELFLLDASGGTNSRDEVAGRVLEESTGQIHAYRAIPCDGNHPGVEGCNYSLVDVRAVSSMRPTPSVSSGLVSPFATFRRNRFYF